MIRLPSGIGTYQEYSLHANLKDYYTNENGQTEVQLENYIIDVVNGNQLIEIQTKNFSQIHEKLLILLRLGYNVKLVHPIYEEKIFRTKDGDKESVRKSPIRDNLLAIFNELVYIPELFLFENFSFEVVFAKIEIVRKKIKANKYRNLDKKLIEALRIMKFAKPEDFLFIIPYELQKRLTTKNFMASLGIKYPLASKIIYFLAKTNMLRIIEKEGNLKIYAVETR